MLRGPDGSTRARVAPAWGIWPRVSSTGREGTAAEGQRLGVREGRRRLLARRAAREQLARAASPQRERAAANRQRHWWICRIPG